MQVLICLSAGNGRLGSLVRKLTNSDVNHSFLAYWDDDWQCWLTVQIDQRGVIIIPADKVEYEDVVCYEYNKDISYALPKVKNLIGSKYGLLGVFGFIFKLFVWRLFKKKILNPIHRDGELFCSEMVTTFLKEADIPWAAHLDPASMSPGDLYDKIDNDSSFQTIPTPWAHA